MTPFGTDARGQAVTRLEIAAGELTVGLLTRGSILQGVRLGDRADLILASDRIADYDGAMQYYGAIVGPVANRIAGATARIDGRDYAFEANQHGNTLHSGDAGMHLQLWEVTEEGASAATLRLALPDGIDGFPGNREVVAHWEVEAPAVLRLTLSATTDAVTPMNLAAHPYWGTGPGHRLRIAADRYLPITRDVLPTGEIAAVEGTGYDFREGRAVTPEDPPLDHNFCLSDGVVPLREVLWLEAADGLRLAIATDAPGMQVYDGRDTDRAGFAPYAGLALESQLWPGALSHPAFPDILLRPGETFRQVTEWRLSRG